jgi:hypothetical protein
MKHLSRLQAPASGWLGRLFALVLLVLVPSAYPSAAAAQEEAGPNIIITSDMPGIQTHGEFQPIGTRLSQGTSTLRSVGPGLHAVTFSAVIARPGYYRVFVWWPQVYGSVGDIDIVVKSLRGNFTVSREQGLAVGQWVPVGIYEFGAGGAQVSLTARPGAILLADAVRLQYMDSQPPRLALETEAVPIAIKGDSYATRLDVIGGTPPFTYVLDRRRAPKGLNLDSRDGTLAGTIDVVGSFEFDVDVFDRDGQRASRTYTIEVLPAAEEPRRPQSSFGPSSGLIPRDGVIPKDGGAAGPPPDLSNLVTAIAAMPEGEWLLANINSFSDVWSPPELRTLVGASNPTPHKLIAAWSGFAWDPNRGDLWLFGGGHANYSGNDVYRWRGSSRMWERASLASEIKQDALGNWQAVDGWDAAPASAHTYDTNMFFPRIDRFVVFGGAAYNSGAAWQRQVTPTTKRHTGPFFFDPWRADPNKVGGSTGSHVMRVAPNPQILGGDMWANRDIYANIAPVPPAVTYANGCSAYVEENGKDVAYLGAKPGGTSALNLYRYTVNDLSNPALDTYQHVGLYWNGTAGKTACGIDPVRRAFVRIGSQTIPFVYWNLATPGPGNKDVRVFPVDPTGEFNALLASNQLTLQNCSLDFDSTRSEFVLWCGDGRVWSLTPPATLSPNGWTIVRRPSPQLAGPNGNVGTGLLGKWKYIPNLDAFMGLQDQNAGNIWIYKPVGWINPGGGATTGPPSGVAASDGTSTSSVSINWNASSGATSYTIYRSASAGVQGAALGGASTTEFVDTTPVPGTIYYYGVTATGPSGVSSLSAQDSGYAAAVIGGGTLSGAAALTSVVDLTAVGMVDWAHWLPFNRMAGGVRISDYVPVGTGNVSTYFDDPRTFTWTNGTPTLIGNDNSGATTSGIGAGVSFSVAADTTPRTLIIYVGGINSTGKLTAHLSDGSAADFVDMSLTGSGRYGGTYTLTFKSASAGQQLVVTWTQAAGTGSISLQAAAVR